MSRFKYIFFSNATFFNQNYLDLMLQGLHIVYDLVQHYCHAHGLQKSEIDY